MQFALDKIHIDFKFEFNGCYTLVSEKKSNKSTQKTHSKELLPSQ